MNMRSRLVRGLAGCAMSLLALTAASQTVNSFTLVNADTDADVATSAGSLTVSLAQTPRLNIRANTSGAKSVQFKQGSTTTVENVAPFAFKGDNRGNYIAWQPAPGVYTITAKPFASTGAAGAAGATATLTLTVQAGGGNPPPGDYIYEVVMGHDGHPDPDDNLASLAGFIAIKRVDDKAGSRAKLLGMIYGDTTENRQEGMIPGGAGSGLNPSTDRAAQANYEFFKRYTKAALQSLGMNTFYDIVPQRYSFDANSLTSMTSGGAFLAQRVRDAIGSKTRVVYSAGGGVNAGAEAIGWLRNQGYSDIQIREHFAIVQHSQWNWDNATEGQARSITGDFVIRIEDQNKYSGLGKPPLTVSASKTSPTFADAWAVGMGSKPSGIDNLEFRRDASDAGSHHFASNVSKIEANWNRRGAPGSVTPISYSEYNTAVMNEQLN
jgi:hypothetical protein